ncbi:MAG: hypothetical protein R3E39_30695 [Anaerolineae bacterium]
MSMTVAETAEAPLSPHWQSYIFADGIPVPGSFHPTHAHYSHYPPLPHCLTIPADASHVTCQRSTWLPHPIVCSGSLCIQPVFCLTVLSSHDKADTSATTTFDCSLAHPIPVMLSFPCYAFSLLARAI